MSYATIRDVFESLEHEWSQRPQKRARASAVDPKNGKERSANGDSATIEPRKR